MSKLEEITIEKNQDILEMPLIEIFGMVAGTMVHEKANNASLIVKGITTDDLLFEFSINCDIIKEDDSFIEKIKRRFEI